MNPPRNPDEGAPAVERDELDWPSHAGKTAAVLAALEHRARRRRARRFVLRGVTAAVLAVLLGTARWRHSPAIAGPSTTMTVVEPRRQVLPDGTVAELAAGAEIAVEFEPQYRFVTLRRGTAHFDVAPNPQRPFVVRVGEIAVRAVGTAFAIELKPDAVTVIVTHGRVALDGGSEYSERRENAAHAEPLALVSAGNLAVVERTPASATAAIPIVSPASETDIDAALAWRRPRLEFSGTPLAEAIAMMNRHNDVKFVLADESLASLRLSGALRADKVDALVQILEADFPVRAERRGERVIELHRR